jgi:hypothetical protein
MTITLTFGTWMIPLVVTIVSFILFLIVYWKDDDYNFSSAIVFLIGVSVTIISWLTWGLMLLLK